MFQDRIYLTDDPDLLAIWKAGTLSNWRCEKKGPAYMKVGKRVFYKGSDLNEFLERHRIEPRNAA